ncbi:amidase [Priestia megaterium]|uniref:amidase n=1 Tax=Priestia megaterium TaxID=1404 RepID=UPI002E200076|nr:amidase [Priestia megaterium]
MKELIYGSISSLSEKIRSKEISPVEITTNILSRIEDVNPDINAFITLIADKALTQANAAEKEILSGAYKGPLHGIPYSLKDNFHTKDMRTTNGSQTDKHANSLLSATAFDKLERSGSVLLGKTNMHEYAFGATNENKHFGAVHNPWKHTWISGGSSGGSGAAVAANMSIFALGTDTGGSVRIPAACCGVTGFKPTYGFISRHGVTPLSPSLDHVGPITKNVRDSALLLNVLAGYDHLDDHSVESHFGNISEKIGNDIKSMRIAIPQRSFIQPLEKEVDQVFNLAIKKMRRLGALVEEVHIDALDNVSSIDSILARAEAAFCYPQDLNTYEESTRALLASGRTITATEYLKAKQQQNRLQFEMKELFNKFDLILTPTLPIRGAKIGQEVIKYEEGASESVFSALIRYTSPFNITGCPAISLPVAICSEGLPISVQLAASKFKDKTLLQAAYALEQSFQFKMPNLDIQT